MVSDFSYLENFRRLLAIAETGLLYEKDVFDKERYDEIKAVSLDLISKVGKEPIEPIRKLFDIGEGYPTPKIDVRAFIKKNNKILLVEDLKTKEWSLPGGFAEIGLTPKENIVKEVLEETGLSVSSAELIAIFDTNLQKDAPQLFQYYKLVFECSVMEGSFAKNNETSNMDYFSINQLPHLSNKRTTKEQLITLETRTKTTCD
ncbi:NUDIX hydrolase N-terminal domain-containing protein [Enterococcus rivorum]|uniref:DNA mismatch repair protein MutT n=1 Tax=Enterococcus rivorum TaxID=762845 RepID=A0A1E5KW08_9ENTE|nr:NUDIX hydrolase [Enterococcus rivorum]MBP2100275.1 ADP-ribose pyrophosphatase YjhB (NUDIX family) [Enterococcus rivorum]OEH81998.1 DNA mismatch repair protein MutT [Enterococcus rivorum]